MGSAPAQACLRVPGALKLQAAAAPHTAPLRWVKPSCRTGREPRRPQPTKPELRQKAKVKSSSRLLLGGVPEEAGPGRQEWREDPELDPGPPLVSVSRTLLLQAARLLGRDISIQILMSPSDDTF